MIKLGPARVLAARVLAALGFGPARVLAARVLAARVLAALGFGPARVLAARGVFLLNRALW